MPMLGRAYLWLIRHNVCPCACASRLRLRNGNPLDKYCDSLERHYLHDYDLSLSEAEARLPGAAIVDEFRADLQKLAQ